MNEGSAPVALTGMPINGEFAQTNTCGSSLAAHSNCSVSVTFEPLAATERKGTIILKGDATNCPLLVELSGKGKGR